MNLSPKQKQQTIDILQYYSDLIGTDTEEVNDIIKTLRGEVVVKDPEADAKEIIFNVSEATGISIDKIKSRSRQNKILIARQYAIYRVCQDVYYKSSYMTLHDVGSLFNLDHSTIIHSNKKIEGWINNGDSLTMLIDGLYNELIKEINCNVIESKEPAE